MDVNVILQKIAIGAIPIIFAITLHEMAHGLAAWKMGDPTAKQAGRITLNPIKHIDPVGTIVIPLLMLVMTGFVFGSAKPVPINPYNFRDPRKGMALSAAAGPGMNFALAVLCILLVRLIVFPLAAILPDAIVTTVLQPVYLMLRTAVSFNVMLAMFNLIPVPPLDGGRVAVGFLPPRQAETLSRLEPFGIAIVLVAVFLLKIGYLIWPVVRFFEQFVLMGH